MRIPHSLALAAALLSGSGLAQEPAAVQPAADAPAAGDFFESIDVNLVNVDVYVTDKKGNRIRGLTKDDFQLFEDKKPMAITNFYAVDDGTAAPPAVPGAPAAAPAVPSPPVQREIEMPEDQRLHLVIYVDNWNIKPFNRNRVFTSLRDFLRNRLSRFDRVMLVTYDREPHVRRPFTSDSSAIASALFEIERLSANGQRQESERREVLREIADMEDVTQAVGRARMYAESVYSDLGFTIDSLKNTVSSLAGLPGRKAILYVSDGIPLVAGEDVFHAIQDKMSQAGSPILESRSYDLSRRYRELIASANSNRITFYSLDAAGLRTPTSISAEEGSPSASGFVDSVHWNNIQSSIRMMAEETGGVAIVNSNDPTKGLAKIGDDLRNYYSLGYSPAHSGDGRYHKVEVKAKNKDWIVRYREGYRDKSTEARMADGVMSALFFDVESNPMGITVQRGEQRPRDDGHFVVDFEVRIPIGKLVLIPDAERQVARVRIFLAAMDDKGGVSEVQESVVPIVIPLAEVAAAQDKTWVATLPLLMRKGPQKLAVGVRDDIAQAASFTVRTMVVGGG